MNLPWLRINVVSIISHKNIFSVAAPSSLSCVYFDYLQVTTAKSCCSPIEQPRRSNTDAIYTIQQNSFMINFNAFFSQKNALHNMRSGKTAHNGRLIFSLAKSKMMGPKSVCAHISSFTSLFAFGMGLQSPGVSLLRLVLGPNQKVFLNTYHPRIIHMGMHQQ